MVSGTHRFQDGIHKLVHLFGVDKPLAFMDAHSQLRYDGQVLLEVLANDVAQVIVVVERLDLLDLAEGIEGVVVEIVDILDVRVRDDDVRQLLHISDSMGYSVHNSISTANSTRILGNSEGTTNLVGSSVRT